MWRYDEENNVKWFMNVIQSKKFVACCLIYKTTHTCWLLLFIIKLFVEFLLLLLLLLTYCLQWCEWQCQLEPPWHHVSIVKCCEYHPNDIRVKLYRGKCTQPRGYRAKCCRVNDYDRHNLLIVIIRMTVDLASISMRTHHTPTFAQYHRHGNFFVLIYNLVRISEHSLFW